MALFDTDSGIRAEIRGSGSVAEGEKSLGLFAQFDTSEGSFTVRLFDREAPKTVENFVALAEGTKAWKDPRTNQNRHQAGTTTA